MCSFSITTTVIIPEKKTERPFLRVHMRASTSQLKEKKNSLNAWEIPQGSENTNTGTRTSHTNAQWKGQVNTHLA
jgi:hypothetical protein